MVDCPLSIQFKSEIFHQKCKSRTIYSLEKQVSQNGSPEEVSVDGLRREIGLSPQEQAGTSHQRKKEKWTRTSGIIFGYL